MYYEGVRRAPIHIKSLIKDMLHISTKPCDSSTTGDLSKSPTKLGHNLSCLPNSSEAIIGHENCSSGIVHQADILQRFFAC